MKTDFYTKAVLTVIAVMLSALAAKQFTQPPPVSAQTQPVAFAVGSTGYLYFYYGGKSITVRGPDGSKKNDITWAN